MRSSSAEAWEATPAVLDQAGGGVGREVAGAQLLGRALQARDERIEGGGVDLATSAPQLVAAFAVSAGVSARSHR